MINLIFIPISLAFDAFAVSICLGISCGKISKRQVFRVSFHFGLFQFGMPVIGWFGANYFRSLIESFDHWVAFGLLAFIGLHMIKESFDSKKDSACPIEKHDKTKGVSLIIYSIATSIDALAAGIALSFLNIDIWIPAMIAGISTFILSFAGAFAGSKLGVKFGRIMEMIGGIILISIGIKILMEHLL